MKNVLVIGLGISGKAVITFLLSRGVHVTAMDRKKVSFPIEVVDEEKVYEKLPFDLIVVSPGVPLSHRTVTQALLEGVEVIGEMELGFRYLNNRVIGVTGTNGKSTTVKKIAHILEKNGFEVALGGNIGTPIISLVGNVSEKCIIVSEVSSFQLETMHSKVFDLALFLNLTPDHLDRHGTMEEYFRIKRRIGDLTKEENAFYIDADTAKVYGEENALLVEECGEFPLLASEFFGVSRKQCIESLKDFESLPHRIEYVRAVKGVFCYNDSKATNEDAVIYATKQLKGSIVLLVGGRNKGATFAKWAFGLSAQVKEVVIFGECREVIEKALTGHFHLTITKSLQDAIRKGLQLAASGDNLLLSPGCSSFDAFLNFEERGNYFKEVIEHESKRYNHHCSTY